MTGLSVITGISTREEWGWEPCREDDDVDPLGITVHWPGDDAPYRFGDHLDCLRQTKAWDVYHRRRGSRMLEYGWLLCQHLVFIEARSTWEHMISRPGSNGTKQSNATRLSMQFMAGGKDAPPSLVELEAIAESIQHARSQGAGLIVDGHCDHVDTDCPGLALYGRLAHISAMASITTPTDNSFNGEYVQNDPPPVEVDETAG